IERRREDFTLFRWAAFAMARVDRLQRAVEIAELGRAREVSAHLRRAESELEAIRVLDPELRDTWLRLQRETDKLNDTWNLSEGADATVTADRLANRREEALEQIRALP